MNLQLIWGVTLRHLYLVPRSLEKVVDLFYWPTVEIIVWGTSAVWITGSTANQALKVAVLLSLVAWRLTFISAYELGVNFLEECISRNLTNLLSTPLKKIEWLVGVLCVGFVKFIILTCYLFGLVYLLFGVNLLSIGIVWIPVLVLLFISGIIFGCLSTACVLKLGIRAQTLTWTLPYIFAPLTGAYFPIAVLPHILQRIGLLLPPTAIFEGLRSSILNQAPIGPVMLHALIINVACLPLAILFLNVVFERVRRRGFDHLE